MRWILVVLAIVGGVEMIAACGDASKSATGGSAAGAGESPVAKPAPPDVSTPAAREALFQRVPTAKAVRATIERLASKPHVAGSHGASLVADDIAQTLGRLGWRTGEAKYDVYLPHPKRLAITIQSTPPVTIATTEPAAIALGEAPMLWAWNAASASGTVTAPLVFANDGRAEDLRTIDVRGKIALLRYGSRSPGAQVASVERAGARAVIFFVDPALEPQRPDDTVQRGTVAYAWQYPGDPLTPGVAATADAPRLDPAKAEVLPKIPVVNVTAVQATKLRAAITAAAPGSPTVEVMVQLDGLRRPIRDILAFLPGASEQAIVLGNHYDAWGYGAIDPHSGTAALLEIARGLTALQRAGWRPHRTIILAFWDAQEFGAIGSTEWVEEQQAMLTKNAVAYFDVETIPAGKLTVPSSPALRELVRGCAASVENPTTKQPFEVAFEDLGVGSDATAFLHHAGVPSLQWTTRGGDYHVWHSILDDATHARGADPDFAFIPALARMMGTCALRLADAAALPLRYSATATWLADAARAAGEVDPALARSIAALQVAATAAEATSATCDAELIAAERGFLAEDGLVGRPWYRHLLIGPDPTRGDGALPLPELAAATTPAARTKARARLVAAIDRATATLASCSSAAKPR